MSDEIDRDIELFHDVLKLRHPVISSAYTYEKPFDYDKDSICVGISRGGKRLNLSFDVSKRVIFIAQTGGGKSWLIRTTFNRFIKASGSVFIVDLKGEYTNSHQPLQEKFSKFMLPREKPEGFSEMKVYYPKFFTKYFDKELEENEEYCQFNITSMNKFDFLTLLENFTENERLLVEAAFQDVGKTIFSLSDFKSYIEDSDYPQPTRKSLLVKIANLENDEVIGDNYPAPRVVEDFNSGMKLVILNLKGIMKFGNFNERAAAYIAIMLRQIYNAKVEKKMKHRNHVMVWLDEVHRWCPSEKDNRNPSSKDEILNMLRLSRSELISMGFSAQNRKDIHTLLLDQCSHVFLSHTVGREEFKNIFKEKLPGEYDSPYDFAILINEILGKMKEHRDGSRDWLMIDGLRKTYTIFRPLAPLTEVATE